MFILSTCLLLLFLLSVEPSLHSHCAHLLGVNFIQILNTVITVFVADCCRSSSFVDASFLQMQNRRYKSVIGKPIKQESKVVRVKIFANMQPMSIMQAKNKTLTIVNGLCYTLDVGTTHISSRKCLKGHSASVAVSLCPTPYHSPPSPYSPTSEFM